MMNARAKRKQARITNRTGSVLLVTLFLIAFSSLLVGGLLHALTSDLQIVRNHATSTKALFVADAGIEDAIAALRANRAWDAGFTQKELPAGSGHHYTVRVVNNAPTAVITSTGVVSGFERRIEVRASVYGRSVPYSVRVMNWKEL